jgi:hypothetical protein
MSNTEELPPMSLDTEIQHLIGDLTPDSLWRRWIMSDEEVTFGRYVRNHSPQSLKQEEN